MNQIAVAHDCGNEKGLVSVDQALQLLVDHTPSLGSETIPLNQALNRYVAADIFSEINLPIFSQSAVDGYAINASAVTQTDSKFELIGEIRAGQRVEVELKQGQAIRIFTGTKIPAGTTTVARQEIVELIDLHNIKLTKSLNSHADIRDVGEEVALGQLIASVGQKLNVGVIAALSMAGVKQVEVYRYPKIAVVVTGDEVADMIECLNSGKIFDANTPMIRAWFQTRNQTVNLIHVEDIEHRVIQLFDRLKEQYDLIITTGGVSVGDYDFVRPAALKLGFQQIFWKVKQKPGKPMLFAKYSQQKKQGQERKGQEQQQDQTHCYLLGLPGNPAAVYIGMQVYVATLVNSLQGQKHPLNWMTGVMSHALKSDARERFLRMHAVFEQGRLSLKSLTKQQSHMLSNLIDANCIVRIPSDQNIQQGQVLQGLFIQD